MLNSVNFLLRQASILLTAAASLFTPSRGQNFVRRQWQPIIVPPSTIAENRSHINGKVFVESLRYRYRIFFSVFALSDFFLDLPRFFFDFLSRLLVKNSGLH